MVPPDRANTLVGIAKAAGVSASTASRVLNGGKPVSAVLEERVMAAARQYGYIPNIAARALRGSANTVAVVVDDIGTASIAATVSGMERAAGAQGTTVTVSASGAALSRQLLAIRTLCSMRPRALVLTGRWLEAAQLSGGLDQELEPYLSGGGRVVIIGDSRLSHPSISISNTDIGYRMGEYMGALGRSAYLVLAGPENHPAMVARTAGFIDGLRAAGVDRRAISLTYCGLTRVAASQAVARVFGSAPVDAVLAANDVLALGAMAELKERGISIPDDVCLAGVDDIPLARDVSPALTTVALPFEEIGAAALRLALEGPEVAGRRIEFSGEIVVRQSTTSRVAPEVVAGL